MLNNKKAIIDEGFTEVASECFYGCKDLKFVDLPSTITNIKANSIYGTDVLICRAIQPPTIGNNGVFFKECYVPDEAVNAYKTATGWSGYVDRIKSLSDYVES